MEVAIKKLVFLKVIVDLMNLMRTMRRTMRREEGEEDFKLQWFRIGCNNWDIAIGFNWNIFVLL